VPVNPDAACEPVRLAVGLLTAAARVLVIFGRSAILPTAVTEEAIIVQSHWYAPETVFETLVARH
jgi:hypothetical protein